MKLIEKIHQYLIEEHDCTAEDIEAFDSASVYVAMETAMYAHHGQTRFNGESYFGYAHRILQRYRDLVGIVEDDYFCLDRDLLVDECNVPYEGMQELCLLADVVNQTDITMEQIEEIFVDLGLRSYFLAHIKHGLEALTKQEQDDEITFVAKISQSLQASIVKFLCYADEFEVCRQMENADASRMNDCVAFCRFLEDRWGFLQNVKKYFELKNNRTN